MRDESRDMARHRCLTALPVQFATPLRAQEAAIAVPDTAFIFNTLLFLIGGFLVVGMAMPKVGLVRSKTVTMQLILTIALFPIAAIIMGWVVGCIMMYPGDVSTVAGGISAMAGGLPPDRLQHDDVLGANPEFRH
jgi:ammonia channel protein AmtB